VVITNTLPIPEEARGFDKLEVLSVAPIVAEALQAIFIDSSVSEIFLGENV
jgi:ribose-phosphate pyrophosphokinase